MNGALALQHLLTKSPKNNWHIFRESSAGKCIQILQVGQSHSCSDGISFKDNNCFTVNVDVDFTLDEEFTPELNDRSSQEFQNLQDKLCSEVSASCSCGEACIAHIKRYTQDKLGALPLFGWLKVRSSGGFP